MSNGIMDVKHVSNNTNDSEGGVEEGDIVLSIGHHQILTDLMEYDPLGVDEMVIIWKMQK